MSDGLLPKKYADINTPLLPHQERVVQRLQSQPGLVVAHGLGSGKTLSAIAAADATGLPTTVVVPAALQANYKKELEKHRKEKATGVDISSLQQLSRSKLPPDLSKNLLIIDEAHRLREPSGKGRQIFNKLPSNKRLLLTGSPLYNHPADLASLVNLASREHLLPSDRAGFEHAFTRKERTNPGFFARLRGVKPSERRVIKNVRPLQNILNKWVDYHEGGADEFPRSTSNIIKVPMSPLQQNVNDALLDKAPFWVRYKIKNGLPPSKQEASQLNAFLTMQRQVANSPQAYSEGMSTAEAVQHSPKIQTAFNNFKSELEKNPAHKAVVYSNYLKSGLDPYKHLLETHNIPYGVFSGQIPKKEREQLVQDYNNNKIKALLVSSAGAEGLDLKDTRQIQLLDPHFNEEKINQVTGRGIRFRSHTHLPDAERHVNVEHYLSTNRPSYFGKTDTSSDEYIHNRAKEKTLFNKQFADLLTKHPAPEPIKEAEFAPGIPDRNKLVPLPEVKKPLTWQMSLQEHHADVAGHHYDLRLIDPETNHAHSWALPAAHMPEPGKSVLAIPQPTHTADYALNFGKNKEQVINKGYGKGRVKIKALQDVEVFHSKPQEEGTRVRFNIYKSTGPEEYALVHTGPGHNRLVNKTLSASRLPHLAFGQKPKTKETALENINFSNKNEVMMPKYDGAHTLLDLSMPGRIPRLFSYRTPKRHMAGVIEHTHKIPSLLKTRVPKELKGTVLRTETIAINNKGKALPAKDIAGLLNATVTNSRLRQRELKATLKPVILDIEKYKGKSVMHLPFKDRYELAKQVGKQLDMQVTELAHDSAAKETLVSRIAKGQHPHTTEGVVLRPWTVPGTATKAKFRPDHDVYVRSVFGATDKHGKPIDRAGGFSYSHTPTGAIVGRVGTGFDHTTLKHMLKNPDHYVGRVAKVQAEQKYDSGALGKASFMEWHLDKGKQF